MFYLCDEGSNVSILPNEKVHGLGPLPLNMLTELIHTLKKTKKNKKTWNQVKENKFEF